MKHTTLTLAFVAFTAGLHAQTAADVPVSAETEASQLPTTIVTGTLWESDLQKTTASISVLESAQIEASGAQHFGDIINSIPNVTWTAGSSRPRYIQIRGIGENSQFEGETPDSSVRFMVDDLDFTGMGTIGNLFDVQQVEVLRGPQAGAFGVNAAGGVIKIVSNDPTPYWTGQVEGSVGEDSLVAGGVAVGGPIIESDPEQLTFRLSAYQLTQDGFRDNKYLDKDDTNERDEFNTRLKLRWIANEDWQWDATAFYADTDNGYDEWSLSNDEFNTYSDQPGRDEQESFATSLRGTWTGLSSVNVTTITSYTDTDATNSYDGDWSNPTAPDYVYTDFLSLDRDRDVFTQELRFDSVDQQDALGWIDRWTVGFYYNTLDETTDSLVESGATWDVDYESDSYAMFGQFGHDFNERTRLIVGLRVEYYDIDVQASGDFYGSPFDDKTDESETLFGGKITLEHDLTAAQMLFTSAARGYKAGGASAPNYTASTDLGYDDETLWNFETGLRSNWLDGQLVTQLTAFYLYREDPQYRDSAGSGVWYAYTTENGDSADHYGLEAEATWFIHQNWTASAGLGLLEAEGDDGSRDLSNAPHYTYNARIDYVAENGFFANLEVVGSDEYYESNSHDEKRSSFAQFNGAVGYRYNNWTLTIWGRNLFDEEYEKRVFFFDNGQGDKRYENPADPQQFGMTVNYRW
jgi:outer membrane receptor protein involved in Fe transport